MDSKLIKPITTNFSKGLTFAASHLIDAEECQITDNFVFGDGDGVLRREGFGPAVEAFEKRRDR